MKVWIIFVQELKLMAKSPVNLALLLIMPVLMIALMGYAMKPVFKLQNGQGLERFKVLCVVDDQDGSGQRTSQEDASSPGDSDGQGFIDYLKATGLVEPVVISRSSMTEKLESGDYPAAVIIPAGFAERAGKGEKVQLDIILSGKDTLKQDIINLLIKDYIQAHNTSSALSKALSSQDGTQASARAGEMLMEIQTRYDNKFIRMNFVDKALWEKLGSEPYFAVNMLVFFLLAMGTGLGAGIVGDRQTRLYTRITSYPVQLSSYFCGKALSTLAMGLIQASFIILTTTLFMKVQWGRDWLGLLLVVVLLIVFSSGVAILFSSFVQSQKAVSAGLTVVFWILTFIGGGFFPIPALASVSKWTVNSMAFEAIGSFMFGSSAILEWKPILLLAAVSSLVFGAGVLCYKRRALYE